MSVVAIMAATLDDELQDRGIFSLTRHDCEAMVRRMIERAAEIEITTRGANTGLEADDRPF
jgi:hypothetical protein